MTETNFISNVLNSVDNVVADMVKTAYHQYIQYYQIEITLAFTVYVMFIGYQFLTHQKQANLQTISRHLVVLLCVYGLIMNWNLYELFVYKIFTVEPIHFATILTRSAHGEAQTISQSLDHVYNTVMELTKLFLSKVSFSSTGIAFIFYGGATFIVGSVMWFVALMLYIYAKAAMAIALALGPLFILFYLWDATRNLFNAWLNKLFTTALIPVVTSAVLALLFAVITNTTGLDLPIEKRSIYDVIPFLTLLLASGLMLKQVLPISSALGGGILLAGLKKGIELLGNSYSAAKGAASFGAKSASWIKNKVSEKRQEQQTSKRVNEWFQ